MPAFTGEEGNGTLFSQGTEERIMKNKVILLAEDNPDDVQLTLRALKKNIF